MLVNLLVNTILQWIVFLAIPFLVFLIFFRKEYNFFQFLGAKKAKKINNKLLYSVFAISIIYILINIVFIKKYNSGLNDIRFLSFQETGFSVQTFLILLINSIILTSFLEELIFRGFLINTFKKKLGFTYSNHIQAVIFTGIHTLGTLQMNLSIFNIVLATIAVYVMSIYFGKITKESGYSIFYSAFFHGSINLVTGILLMILL